MERVKVIFILGSGHCGSTLLDLMLDCHPAIVGVGEMHGLTPSSECTCGKKAEDCPLWLEANEDGVYPQQIYRTKWDAICDESRYRSLRTHELLDLKAFQERVIGKYGRILEYAHAQIIVDSSKSTDRAQALIDSGAIEPLVIHLVRDGRAVTWSYLRKYGRLWPFLFKWAAENIKIELFKRRAATPVLFMRFEDLVCDPTRELMRVTSALGISFDPVMLDFRKGEHHQVGGNRMRFGRERNVTRDDVWRHDMPRSERYLFSFLFGWLNQYYKHHA